jgi:hypothetical protein
MAMKEMTKGLAAFGFTIGLTVALSRTAGASATMLTSLFTFVGGVLLTYGGFHRRARASLPPEPKAGDAAASTAKPVVAEPPTVDVDRVGSALFAMAIGVTCGLISGIYFREKGPQILEALPPRAAVHPAPSASGAPPAAPTSTINVGIQDGQTSVCAMVSENLEKRAYAASGGLQLATGNLSTMKATFCEGLK